MTSGERLRFTFTRTGGDYPLAIWIWPCIGDQFATQLPGGRSVRLQPAITLVYNEIGSGTRAVFQSRTAKIFELSHPAPYFEASGECIVKPESRLSVRLTCRTPAKLLRRELFYPGCRDYINGRPAAKLQAHSIFQMVDVPPGESQVNFEYSPTNISWAYCAALAALLLLAYRAAKTFSLRDPQITDSADRDLWAAVPPAIENRESRALS